MRNYPSISFGALPGKGSVTRTVTNTTNQRDVYFGDVKAPAGYTVTVNPKVLLVAPAESATFALSVTRTTAPFGTDGFGSLTWLDLFGHLVTSPIAVQATALSWARRSCRSTRSPLRCPGSRHGCWDNCR